MKAYKPAKTPIIKRILIKTLFNYKTPKTLLKGYKKFKSNLIYLITKTRFNIYYAVSQLGQFSSNPTDEHYTQLK